MIDLLGPSDGATEPTIWWLFWMGASVALYVILLIWFWRVGKAETREPPPE